MASNSESPTRSRRKQKQKRNEMMEVEVNQKDDVMNRSIEDIRSKMKEKRRKKAQADLSLSRSRHKNANLILKATLRLNNRSLAKSLETAKSECRQAQSDLLEVQRERHLLQSVVNRFQDQHIKQRNQIKGVHQTLRKVTSSLMDAVGSLAEAMDQCVIPRHTKDRSLGLVFRTSCSLTSDDLSDSETRAGSSANTSTNLSGAPQRVPTNKDAAQQPAAENIPSEEEEALADLDIPLLFSSGTTLPQEREKTRRDTRNISAGNGKLSRRTSSLLDPATMAAVATEIGRSAEDIRTVMEETGHDGESDDERLAMICIDEEERVHDEGRGVRRSRERRVSRKRSGRPSSRKEAKDLDAYDHARSEVEEIDDAGKAEEERLASIHLDEVVNDAGKSSQNQGRRVSKKRSKRSSTRAEIPDQSELEGTDDAPGEEDQIPVDENNEKGRGARRSGRLSKKRISYAYPDNDSEEEIKEEDDGMELGVDDGERVGRRSDTKASKKRSGRLSRRRGTFVKEDVIEGLQEIEIVDDEEEAVVDVIMAQQRENVEETVEGNGSRRDTYEIGTEAARIGEQPSEQAYKKSKKKKSDTKLKKVDSKGSKPDQKQDNASDNDNSTEKSDYRIMDMELTSAANGHISIINGSDHQTKDKEENVDVDSEKPPMEIPDGNSHNDSPDEEPQGSVVPCKEKPKSRLPVSTKSKSNTSKLKKSSHKGLSRIGAGKDSKKRCDEKDVQNMTVFDLSMGDSFSHPTPTCLKKKSVVKPNLDKDAAADGEVCPVGGGAGDGSREMSSKESSRDADEDDFANQDTNAPRKVKKDHGEGKHSKIKRKSRKAKSVVTPEAPEPKVRLSKKALLEEVNNLDASYLSDVTNHERKTLMAASLPSRKSSQKDEGESLSDLMVRPHHRKTSKRKLSKRSFYFGDSETEEDQRRSRAGRTSEAKTSEVNTSTLDTSLSVPDKPNPDSTFSLPKTSMAVLDTSIDILDIENILLEADQPKVSKKKIQRRTTILKQHGQTSKRTANLNVTFNKDDLSDFEAVKKDKVGKTTRDGEAEPAVMTKAKNSKQSTRKTFNIDDIAKTFFGSSKDFDLGDEDELSDEGENVITDTQTLSKHIKAVQPPTGSPASTTESRTTSRTGDADILEDFGRSSGVFQEDKEDQEHPSENSKDLEDLDSNSDVDLKAEDSRHRPNETNSKYQTAETVEPLREDDASGSANDDGFDVLDMVHRRSSQSDGSLVNKVKKTKTQKPPKHLENIVLDKAEVEVEAKETKLQKTNKRELMLDDGDDLEGNPSKVVKTDVPEAEAPGRRGRRGKPVSYKEPSLHSKLRRGDPGSSSVYGLETLKTQKKNQKFRVPLSTVN